MVRCIGLALAAVTVASTAACGSAAAPAAPKAASKGGAASASAPSTAQAPAGQAKPAASRPLTVLRVATPANGGPNLPLNVAVAAGYFQRHGLKVEVKVLSPTTSVAALQAGSVQIYAGGVDGVAADLHGAHFIYAGEFVDRSTLALIGRKGVTTFAQLRGQTVATTSPGAFGDIALHAIAPKYGMVAGQSFHITYNSTMNAVLSELESGKVAAGIAIPPWTLEAEKAGYPVIVDFLKEGFRIAGPAAVVKRSYFNAHQAVLKAFFEGYLDGLKRTLDDPTYALNLDVNAFHIPQAVAQATYTIYKQVWKKNLSVNPASLQVALQVSKAPAARTMKLGTLYDNSIVDAINASYARKLFPNALGGSAAG